MFRYLPIGGFKPYVDVTMKLAYGDDADVLKNHQVAAVQVTPPPSSTLCNHLHVWLTF